jgi:hypothetical protein
MADPFLTADLTDKTGLEVSIPGFFNHGLHGLGLDPQTQNSKP